jgi:hypothetical protein
MIPRSRRPSASCGYAASLNGLRLFDLQDHLRTVEHGLGVGHDGGSLRLVLIVVDRRALAGPFLDENTVAAVGQLTDADRGDSDPVLGRLDLPRNPNDHA